MKIIFVALLLSLSACASPPKQITQCKDIGIDAGSPDFTQKHKRAEIEEFYSCTQTQLQEMAASSQPTGLAALGKTVLKASKLRALVSEDGMNPQQYATMYSAIEYQKNLWLQVISKEKKPNAAKEDWFKWLQQERLVVASNQTAAASQKAARAAQAAAQSAEDAAIMQNSQTPQPQQWMMNQGDRTYLCNNYGGTVNCN